MKQTSLLDSFIKRQKKQDPKNEQVDPPIQKTPSAQITKAISTMKKKNTIDSDEEDERPAKKYLMQSHQSHKNSKTGIKIEIENQSEQMDIEEDEKQVPKQMRQKKSTRVSDFVTRNQSEQQTNPLAQFTDATPLWAQKQHCMDANMKRPSDPNYDPTTLYIPDQAWSKFTAPMKQFWKIKQTNFDKLILFKLGKFYEMFYDDAMVGNKYLDLKFMGTKMHAGFPEKTLDKYVEQFVNLGFKTAIVEQMETPDQMQERIKSQKAQGRKSEKTINRQVTQIITKGTMTLKDEEKTYLPNYLISISKFGEQIAFALLEIASNEISLGIAENMDRFKTILFQTRPVQAIFDPDNIPFEMQRMMEKTFLQVQISKIINKKNLWHPLTAICELQKLEKQQIIKKSKIFAAIDKLPEIQKNLTYSTLSGMFHYLHQVMKFDYVINAAKFTFYQKQDHAKNMTLDSQALQHLEIFETVQGSDGSLFSTIDHTKTKFGKRLLRRWLMSPLMNTHHINQRLNALEDLNEIIIDRQRCSNILKKLPDLDKKVNKLYHYAIKTTSASKAIYFEDVNTARLKEFNEVMKKMKEGWEVIQILRKNMSNFRSLRLKQLLKLDKNISDETDIYYEDEDDQSTFEGLLPNIPQILAKFNEFVEWGDDNVPLPQQGLHAMYDQCKEEIEYKQKQLQEYLEGIRMQMKEPNLKFVHAKQRYEIEVPKKSDKNRPNNFQFTSQKTGFSRYTTSQIKQMVKDLEHLEEKKKQNFRLFIGFFFEEFSHSQKFWQRYIEILSELDCLIGLSEYSFMNDKVRPRFAHEPKFEIKDAKHPCLTNIDFITNDISLEKKVMLLTGPNMGGKSTTLRTACTLVVLAQIGCYVPASKYECETIDRIFTRIGASDKLQLGKSTFFIQMEQTQSILNYGTSKSLAIIDELGRGTSTFDGMSIAYSVLRHILYNIKCYCLFATHYHVLVQEFEKEKDVELMMMDSLVSQDRLIFLYKLVPGHVHQSFGLNVAKIVGISPQTLALAEKKAGTMTHEIKRKRQAILGDIQKFLHD